MPKECHEYCFTLRGRTRHFPLDRLQEEWRHVYKWTVKSDNVIFRVNALMRRIPPFFWASAFAPNALHFGHGNLEVNQCRGGVTVSPLFTLFAIVCAVVLRIVMLYVTRASETGLR